MSQRMAKQRSRSGAIVVEFAMMLPVLFLFFGAAIEVCRVLLLQHTVDAAAYEGARAGMVPGATATEAAEAATRLLRTAKLRGEKVTVTPENLTEITPLITVRVEVPISENSWTSIFWFGSRSISSEVTLFCERPALVQLTGVPAMKLLSLQLLGIPVSL